MPTVYNTLGQLLGTGSIPDTDLFGNTTTTFGSYIATGIDFWSLPGVITPAPHNGIFKRGPVALYVSSSDRHYWWGARIRDVDTPIVDVYSVSDVGSTLRYSSSVLPSIPRTFDFELNQNGHVVIVAEIEEKLYGFYSFSSSFGWQLIASESFTPKLLSIDNTCCLAYINNNTTYSGSDRWYPNLVYELSDDRFSTGSRKWLVSTNLTPYTLPDSIAVTPVSTYGWSGSLSGTLNGIMTGSLKGQYTGTIGSNLYGSFKIGSPAILYDYFSGDLSGTFGGNFLGDAIATGSFYGTLYGTFSGTYYTASAGIVSQLSQGTGPAPANINFFVGSISGALSGGVYPHSQSVVKPIYFIQDFIPTVSNRLLLIHGQYDPIQQSVSYTESLSAINVTAAPGTSTAGGVPFAMELYQPTNRISPPFLSSSIGYDGTRLDGSASLVSAPKFAVEQISVSNLKIVNGSERYYWHLHQKDHKPGAAFPSLNNIAMQTYDYFGYGNSGIHNSGGFNEINWSRIGAGAPSYAAGTYTVNPTTVTGYEIKGIIFPSQSRYSTTFDGTHIPLSGCYQSGTLNARIYQYVDTFGGPTVVISTPTATVGAPGVPTFKDSIYVGVKLKPLLTESTASFTCSMIADPASNYVNTASVGVSYAIVSSSLQVVLAKFLPFVYTPDLIGGSADVIGYAPDPGSKTWYPDVTLYMSFTGSTSGIRYHTTMSATSYFLHTNANL